MENKSKKILEITDDFADNQPINHFENDTHEFSSDQPNHISELSQNANFLIDEHGYINNLNKTAVLLLKYKIKELINTEFVNLLTKSSRAKNSDLINKIIRNEIFEFKAELKLKNNDHISVNVNTWKICSNGSNYYLVSCIDISKLKTSLKEMEYEKNLFRTLMDNIPDRIYFKDVNSKFTLINKAQCKNFHLDQPSDAIGLCDHDFFNKKHADDALQDEQQIITSKKGIVSKIERERVKSPLRNFEWVNSTKVPILNKKGKVTGIVGITRDVTDLKNAENKIQKYAKELQYLNSSKDKFISILAHDLKNPFFSLIGYADMLENNYDELNDDERKEYVHNIIKISKNSYQLLENLLEWARSQTGRIEYRPKIIELNLLFNDVIELIKPLAEKKEIVIENMLDKSINVYADSDMLRTIMRNLLTNAIKFTNVEGIIKITQTETDDKVNTCVEDNGTGMDTETVRDLFKIDCQHKSIGTLNEKGTGLGLLICKEFIEKNGGQIFVESKKDKGSKFSFTLPIYT